MPILPACQGSLGSQRGELPGARHRWRPGSPRSDGEPGWGAYTLPQIFIDDLNIGGCDELHALEGAQKLDGLLQGKV